MERKSFKNRYLVLFYVSIALIAVSYFFVLALFRYEDTVSFTAWCATFWDSLFSGNLGQYFTYAQNNYRGAIHNASYVPWVTFIPWIIWNFPVYLFNPLSKNADVGGMKCIIWSKLFLIVCLIILCIYVFKLLMNITKDNFEFSLAGVLLVASSLEILSAVAYSGQDEIVYITTFTIALHQFIKGKKRSGLAFSVLTVTINPLMIIPFLVMILLLEKRIWAILLNAALCLLPGMLFEVVYRNDLAYQQEKTANTKMVFQSMMNKGTIDTTIGPTSIAVVLLIILLFVAYFKKVDDGNRAETLVYYCSIAFFSLCFLTYAIWYRYFLYVPFFVLMAGSSEENRNIKVFLLELLLIFRFIPCLSNFYNFNYDFLSTIGIRFFGEKTGSVIDPISSGFDNAFYISRPVSLAAALLLLVLCNKRFDKKLEFKVPWKAVAFASPIVCALWCAIVILK